MKYCAKCDKEKEIEEFHKHPATHDKRFSICKECANKISKKRYETLKEDPEKFQEERNRYNAQKRARVAELKKLRKK